MEYWQKGENSSREINVRYEDLFFLCDEDNNWANKYLELILNSRRGDRPARKELKVLGQKYLREIHDFYLPLSFYEDRYVVPSMSDKVYDDRLISDKGTMLLQLTQEGYPVPDFCILTASYYLLTPQQSEPYLKAAIVNLENMTRQYLGSDTAPLVFALRCAMPQYIPGLMPTYLNVGVIRESYQALKRLYDAEVAGKIYIHNLKNLFLLLFPESRLPDYEELIKDIDGSIGYLYDAIGQTDPLLLEDPYYQVSFFIKQVHEFYEHNRDLLYTFVKKERQYPSLILQKMVWTVRQDESYPGVLYSRHSRTGLGTQIESVRNIFGEDIMTGMANTDDNEYFNREEIKVQFPGVYHVDPLLTKLEEKLQSPVTIEFAAESSNKVHYFAILQLNASAVTGRAILLSSIDMYEKRIISKKRVIELIQPYHLTQIFSDRIDDRSFQDLVFFCKGVSILPRTAVSAHIYFSAQKALAAKKKGQKVCFCKESFLPSDTLVMAEVDAIISLTPAAIHVVTACRGYGVPAFLNLEDYGIILEKDRLVNPAGLVIKEGDWITLSSKRKMIFCGRARYTPARFKKYLDGERFELEAKEAKVFINMTKAFTEYQKLVKSLQYEEIVDINDLVKLIQTDLRNEPDKARNFLNTWFDAHMEHYVDETIKSELGTHNDQHGLYKMLTLDRKILFFKKIIKECLKRRLMGFTAGSFMLGRFLSQPHPVSFWKEFSAAEIVFMLNEVILFEKYLKVLNDVGERRLNRARKRILNEGLDNIYLNIANARTFTTLKLYFKDWDKVIRSFASTYARETRLLIDLLQKPFGEFYDYSKPWSYNELKRICDQEKLPVPEAESQ